MRSADWISTHRRTLSARPVTATSLDSEGALTALASAMRQPDPDGSTRKSLQLHVLEYCALARGEGVTPERMIVRLKHTLDGALSITIGNPRAQEEARTNIISMAINAYYDDKG